MHSGGAAEYVGRRNPSSDFKHHYPYAHISLMYMYMHLSLSLYIYIYIYCRTSLGCVGLYKTDDGAPLDVNSVTLNILSSMDSTT